jgi:hypothetical protein
MWTDLLPAALPAVPAAAQLGRDKLVTACRDCDGKQQALGGAK